LKRVLFFYGYLDWIPIIQEATGGKTGDFSTHGHYLISARSGLYFFLILRKERLGNEYNGYSVWQPVSPTLLPQSQTFMLT